MEEFLKKKDDPALEEMRKKLLGDDQKGGPAAYRVDQNN
jgi:hypothetical protein